MTLAHEIGNRIFTQRLRLGLSQEQLRSKMAYRISKSHLSDLENGKRLVGAEKLLVLSEALGVSTDWLLKGGKR